jgi:hypothetical protein
MTCLASAGCAPKHPCRLELPCPSSTCLVQIERLNLFFISIGLRHLARAQHSFRKISGLHVGLSVFYTVSIHIILSRIHLKIS